MPTRNQSIFFKRIILSVAFSTTHTHERTYTHTTTWNYAHAIAHTIACDQYWKRETWRIRSSHKDNFRLVSRFLMRTRDEIISSNATNDQQRNINIHSHLGNFILKQFQIPSTYLHIKFNCRLYVCVSSTYERISLCVCVCVSVTLSFIGKRVKETTKRITEYCEYCIVRDGKV